MKITKRQLRRIIKEEIDRQSPEYIQGYDDGAEGYDPAPAMLNDAVYMLGYEDGYKYLNSDRGDSNF